MKKSVIIILSLALLLPLSCSKTIPQSEPRLVVEGWIETGGHPMVRVSESFEVEMGKEISLANLVENLAKWARVSVSDGDTTVVLTGFVDQNYFPPYVFSSSKITGKTGKTYELKVEYKDYVATAKTTLPEPVPIDTVYVGEVKDSTCVVVCGFTDPPQKGNNYKVLTRAMAFESHYHHSCLALTDDEKLNGYTEFFLFSSLRLTDFISIPNIRTEGDFWVKLCTLDQEAYAFWKHYETILYANTFNIESGTAMLGNVNGALGYWVGYGVDKPVCINLDNLPPTQ